MVASGEEKPAYTDVEAAKHINETATVTGKVFGVSTSGKGTTFLNIGGRYPNHTFGGVIFAKNTDAVGDVKQYEGKEVSLTGRIEMSPDQKPQIVITKPDQIKLAGTVAPPAPAPPVVTATKTAPPSPAPADAHVSEPPAKKVGLAGGWNSPRRDGETVRKDLARLLGEVGVSSESTRVDTSPEIYPGLPFLAPLVTATKILNLDSAQVAKSKVSTAGFPQDSFTAHVYTGVFPGGFSRLYLVTDSDDQVVSVLLVDSESKTRVTNEPDSSGYHTYNFIAGAGKAGSGLVVRHRVTPGSTPNGVVIVDTLLIDPNDIETQGTVRTTKGGSGKSGSSQKPKTGKVLERSRWFVPAPIVNLILRCVGG
ncbi:MAG: hypothetical protein WCN98_20370 [Verrucomicrobiaceae bacterium]